MYSPRRCGSVAQMALCSLRIYHHTHDYQQSKPIISVVLSCRRLGAVLSSVEIRATISVASVSVGCMCGYTPKRPCATRSCSASSTHGGLPDRQSSSRQREKADGCSGQPDQKQEQLGADSNAKFSHHVLMWIGNVKDRPAGMTHLRKSMSATHIGSISSARDAGGASESSGDCR